MQKLHLVLIAAVLMSGTGFAQEKSSSVDDILKELMAYEPDVPAAEPMAPVVEPDLEPEAVVPVEFDVMKDVPVESADVVFDVPPVLDLYSEAEVASAGKSIAEAVAPAPDSRLLDSIYPRSRLERHHRTAEIQGLEAVDAAWSTDVVLRSYTLASGASERMNLADETSAVDVKTLFPQVEFSKESSAIYQPETKTIFVYNTPENHVVLEIMLKTMGVLKDFGETDQVEIEAKFIEVSAGALEELGFEWNFTDPVSVGDDYLVDDGVNGLFANALRGSPSGTSPNLPFSRAFEEGAGQDFASGDWSAFGITDTFDAQPDTLTLLGQGSDSFELLISALDQSSGTDVLSAPRIVTRSGEEATIRVGELHYYPEVFEGESDQATFLAVSYQDFEEKLLGIELAVTPEVDGDQIDLALSPLITELAGWQRYQLAPANSIYNHRQLDKTAVYKSEAVVDRLPIFKKRSIETSVRIANGSTIGMGGLISEKNETYKDKVPLLGSLPLVGRLFRNEGERVVKRNLLMFVTARKVDPSGRIITTRSFE